MIWSPIADLSLGERAWRDTEVAGLLATWLERRDTLVPHEARRAFEEKLARDWAIETAMPITSATASRRRRRWSGRNSC